MRTALFSVLLAVGCSTPITPTDDGPDGVVDPTADTGEKPTDGVTNELCFAVVTDVDPLNEAGSVPLNSTVTVTFSEPVEDGAWALSVQGVKGVSMLASNGLSATFVPDAFLEIETTYTIDAQVCADQVTSTFTTVGPPVTKVDVEGNTYALDWSALTFVEPPRGGAALAGSVQFTDVVFQFVSIDDKTQIADVAATVAIDQAGTLNAYCPAYVSQSADFSTNPYFEFGPTTVEFPALFDSKGNVKTTVQIEDLALSFEVSADGTELLNPTISGLLPTEDLLGDACPDSFAVALAKGTCVKCKAATSGLCLMVEATSKTAALEPKFDLAGECAP